MALNAYQLKLYSEELNKKLENKTITRPILFTDNTVFFLILNGQNEYLAISMDQENPRVYIGDSYQKVKTLENNFFKVLNKELSRAYIDSVFTMNNDRIMCIKTYILNDIFEEELRYIYLELIPHHPNLIITKEDNTILTVYKQSALTTSRPLMRNLKYEVPLKGDFIPKELPFNVDEYTNECLSLEDNLYIRRKKNLYGPIEHKLKQELKTLKNKDKALLKDENLAKSRLSDAEIGTYILTMQSQLNGCSSFDYYGTQIEIDPRLGIFGTANKYFTRSKKAKRQIENIEKNRLSLNKDLNNVSNKLFIYNNGTFDDIDEKLVPLYTKNNKKKSSPKQSQYKSSELPFVVKNNDVTYLYGKNRLQNDRLTFYIDKSPNHIWIHPLGIQGTHLMIKKDFPTEDEIRLGCELALLSTGLDEGQLMVAYRKNVYKNGAPGSVNVLEYETIRINNISEETKELFAQETKYEQ